MARSALSPNESHTSEFPWENATVPQFLGWQFKSDTSSDEVVGHMFAFSGALHAMELGGFTTPEYDDMRAELATYLVNIVDHIVSNG